METIAFRTNDGVITQVKYEVAKCSMVLDEMVKDLGDSASMSGTEIPLPDNVKNCEILAKVIVWCNHALEQQSTTPVASAEGSGKAEVTTDEATSAKEAEPEKTKESKELTDWEKEYCNVDSAMLFELIQAANFLDIKPLLNALCKTVADSLKGKSVVEMRLFFGVENDFTPEEEEAVRKETEWAEEN